MRPRGIVRFAFAVVVLLVLYLVTFPALLALGASFGGWGYGATLALTAMAFALIFTAIYDGPREFRRLLRRRPQAARGIDDLGVVGRNERDWLECT